jgi:hypothetical protein
MINMKQVTVCVAAMIMLAGCTGSDVRNTLGLGRRSPDAFSVVSRPPLTVPKEFLLVQPGSETPEGVAGTSAKEKARALLLKQSSSSAASPEATPSSPFNTADAAPAQPAAAEQEAGQSGNLAEQMRQKVGVKPENEQTRKLINQEQWTKEQAEQHTSVVDLFSKGLHDDSADDVLNAQEEAARLKAQTGKVR